MTTQETKEVWVIKICDSLTVKKEFKINKDDITEDKLKELLRTLIAKYSPLDYDEIIDSYVKRGAERSRGLLEVLPNRNPDEKKSYMCATNPHAIAYLKTEDA